MLDGWVVGLGIEFVDGGAPQRLAELAKQLRATSVLTRTLTADNKNLAASFVGLADAERAAATGMGGFASANRAAAGSSGAAAAAARAQAASLWGIVVAANAAAAAMGRAGAASAAGAGFGIGGAFGAPMAPERSWHDVGAYAQPAMRSVGYSRLAGGTAGGWMSPWAAGMMGGGPGGPAGRVGQRALPGGSGGGGGFESFTGGGGGGGRGPGGGGFNGSGFSSMAGTLGPGALRLGIRGAKLGAEAGLGLAWDAVHEAGRYQQIMTSVENVTGANAAQMARARKATFDVGHMSATSVSESAEMLREITRQSQGAMPFSSMLDMLPYAAKLQVVLGATRGFTPTQTVDSTMALTHLFRQYNPKGMPKMFDTVLRMGELMPTDLNAAVRQMTYFEPVLKSLHVPDADAATMMVAMSRFGMGKNKGGASLADLADQALGPLQMTKHVQAGKAALLGPKGLNVLDAHGTSRFFTDKGGEIFGFLDQLAKYEGQHGSIQSRKVFRSAFGSVGSRLASLVSDPVIIDQLHKIHDVIAKQKTLGLDSQAHSFFGNVNFGQKQAWSDFQSLMTEIGGIALPGATKSFHDLADSLHGATVWLRGHGDLEKHVQSEITSAVRETEGWIISHQGDFKQLGKDALWAMDNVHGAGKSLSELADDILAVSNAARAMGGWYNSWPAPLRALIEHSDAVANIAHSAHDIPKSVSALAAAIARNKAIDEARRGHGYGDLPRGPTHPGMGPPSRVPVPYIPGSEFHRSGTRRVVHEHHLHLHGGDTVSRHEVRKKVEEVLSEGSSDPRHHTGKNATIHTSARQPTRLTTTTGP